MLTTRLKELREKALLSQAALADTIGIAQTSIGNYERGERIPDADVLIKYSQYFNVSTDYLLGLSDIQKPSSIYPKIDTLFSHNEYSEEVHSIFEDLYKFFDAFDKEFARAENDNLKENWDTGEYWNYDTIDEIVASRVYEISHKTSLIRDHINLALYEIQKKELDYINNAFDSSREELEKEAKATIEE